MSTLLTVPEVIGVTKMSKASLYRRMADGSFPQPVRVGPRSIRFLEDEVNGWMADLATDHRRQARSDS